MFCPTNTVLVAGSMGPVTWGDLAGAAEAPALTYPRTHTFIYIFKNVYVVCIENRETYMHNVNACAVYICESCVWSRILITYLIHSKNLNLKWATLKDKNAATANSLPQVPIENYIITDHYNLHRPEKQIEKLSELQTGRKNTPGVIHNGVCWLFIKPTHSSRGNGHLDEASRLSILWFGDPTL